MDRTKEFLRLVLDPTTLQIVQLAALDGLYPTQIARKLGKSKGLVAKKLGELEKNGVLKGRFETSHGSVVKRYELVTEEIFISINFKNGEVKVQEKKREPQEAKPSERVKELFK